MEKAKRAWKRTPKPVRQALVFVVGGVVIIAGIIMLVTPGPGWAALFLGFAIWATEFAFAEKVRDRMVAFFKHLGEVALGWWHKIIRKK